MKLANQQDMYTYALRRLVGGAVLNVFYSKRNFFWEEIKMLPCNDEQWK